LPHCHVLSSLPTRRSSDLAYEDALRRPRPPRRGGCARRCQGLLRRRHLLPPPAAGDGAPARLRRVHRPRGRHRRGHARRGRRHRPGAGQCRSRRLCARFRCRAGRRLGDGGQRAGSPGAAVRDHRCRDPRTGVGRCGGPRRLQDRSAAHGRHRLEPDGRTDGGPRCRRGGTRPRDHHRRRTAVTLPGIVAVDVGGTKIRAGSVIDGRLGQVRTVPTPASAGAQAILDAIAEVASAVIAGAQTIRDAETTRDTETSTDHSAAAVTGRVTEGGTGLVTETGAGRDGAVSDWRIGVGAAGVIDPVAGTVVSATESLTGWAGTRLVDELEARTRLRVRAVNDVHAHALGEAAAGASHGTDSSLLVAAGTGIGGGIIWDGRLLTGRNSAAGHIGHLPSPAAADLPCPCGGTGHVEAIASGPAILDTYRRLLAREGPSRQDEEGPGPHGAAAAPEPTTPASA